MPAISVIISEYNTPIEYFNQAIESMLIQTFTDYEIIFIDDSKDQHLEKYLEKYEDSRIKIIKNGRNLGFVPSLNKAIDLAQADYLIRMDTDDICMPTRFESLYNEIQKFPEYSVIGSSIIEFDETGKYIERINDCEHDFNAVINRNVPVHPTTIMRKGDIVSVGKYKNYNRAEDFVLWSELLINGFRIKSIPEILLKYRVSESDLDKRKLKFRKDEIRARLKYYRKMGASPLQMLSISKSILAGILPNRVMYYYHNIRK